MDLTTSKDCIEIASEPEKVWRALTDQAESASWYFGTGIESSFEPGAPYQYAFLDGRVAIEGIVHSAEPPHTLAMTFHALWSDDVAKDAPTLVTWSAEPSGDGSLVCVTHEELVPGSATENEVATGWPELLGRLKRYVEGSDS